LKRSSIVIVTPALASANNGNWQTARRWQRMLSQAHSARITDRWPDEQAEQDEVILALHARRSAASIDAWAQRHGSARLVVVLTGTDLYRDIATDAQAQRSLDLASHLVVLQDEAPHALPAQHRAKARVIFQSTTSRQRLPKTGRHLRAVMVGHLRDEKDPLTLMAAARLISRREGILIDHIGSPLDAALERAARETMAQCPHYRWLGGLPHAQALSRIQRAHLLVHASRMEGGAHVVMEAVCSGTPVLASRMDGNVGMLGRGYSGYFAVGDAQGLAQALRECRTPGRLEQLMAQCELRAPLFAPHAEQAALLDLIGDVLQD
jgi:putative glycosyltransferase (TIGR04348 family)